MTLADSNPQAALPKLRIRIIGAGIGGLACGLACAKAGFTDVVVYESAKEIAEVGAGIQTPPNETRILARLGVLEDLRPSAVALSENSLRRYEDDSVLGHVAMMPAAEEKYGAPLWVVHRADLQRVLRLGAERAGVVIKTGARVVEVDFAASRLKIQDQDAWIEGDVVIAADGIKSLVRQQIAELHGTTDASRSTGDAAYRILIPRADLENEPDLLELLDSNLGIRWMGPGGHIMAYAIKAHQMYNMVLLHPDSNNASESWTTKGSKKEMLDFYSHWNPTVQKLLKHTAEDNIMEWKLMDHASLPTWIEGNTALIGDSCHPMLPYVAQGAAQAIEDGAVIAAVLTGVEEVGRVPNALRLYEKVRKPRAEAIQASAAETRVVLHYPDGPKQKERDETIRKADSGGANPDKWSDASWQQFMWGTDCVEDALKALAEIKGAKYDRHILPHGVATA